MNRTAMMAALSLSILMTSTLASSADARRTARASKGTLFKGRVSYKLTKGENLMRQRKYEEAKELFSKELNKNSRNVEALDGMGMALAMQYKLDAAEKQFDKAISIDPSNSLAHAGKATVMLHRLQSSSKTIIDNRNNILNMAENEARLAISNDPDSQYAHYTLGRILEQQERLPEATQAYQQAVTIDPQYSTGYTGLGLVALKQENLQEAYSSFHKAIELNTGNSTAHYGLGEVLLKQGQADAAIKELNTSLYLRRNSAPVQLALGKAYEMQGNNDAALKCYEKASLIKPEMKEPNLRRAKLHVKLGAECQQQGNVVGALKEFKQAILVDPYLPDAYLAMADMREGRGDMELAIAEMRSGLELNPNQTVLRQRVADSLLKLEKLDDSIKEYKAVLDSDPGNSPAIDGLTRALYLKAHKTSQEAFSTSNDYESAMEEIQKAISLKPNDFRLRLAAAKIKALAGDQTDLATIGHPITDTDKVAYAETLLAQNKFKESKEMMSEVIARTTDSQQLLAVADLASMIRDLDSAQAAYTRAAQLDPANKRAKRGLSQLTELRAQATREENLGFDFAKRKQMKSAIDSFRLAVKSNPRGADARFGLAEVERKFGKKSPGLLKDSATQYRAYVSLNPDLPEKKVEKLTRLAEKLDEKAKKLEAKNVIASGNIPNQ